MNAVPTQNSTSDSSPRPYLRVQPDTGWLSLNWREIWRFRDLLATLATRDVKLRYRQTALGVIWVILQPLLGAGILSFVFSGLMDASTDGISPLVFSFAGMLAFTLFSSILTKSSNSLVQNSQMISKVFFPRLILPFSVTLSSFLDFAVGLAVMIVLMIFNGIVPGFGLLLLPLWMLLITLFALGCGLFFGALMVSYRDVQYVLPVLVSLLTFASPVGYSLSNVTGKLPTALLPLYFVLNPLASLLTAVRWSLLGRGEVNWGYVALAAVISVAAFVVGAIAFKSMEGKFADVI